MVSKLFIYIKSFFDITEGMSTYPFTQPQAPESNPPIAPQFFQPSAFVISNISLGNTTTVTTEPAFGVDNNYVIGQLVRFIIPPYFGTIQLNGMDGYVIDTPTVNQVTVNINTSMGYNAFIPSPSYSVTPAQILAIGDINSGLIAQNGRNVGATTIPGTFTNTSPVASG